MLVFDLNEWYRRVGVTCDLMNDCATFFFVVFFVVLLNMFGFFVGAVDVFDVIFEDSISHGRVDCGHPL